MNIYTVVGPRLPFPLNFIFPGSTENGITSTLERPARERRAARLAFMRENA